MARVKLQPQAQADKLGLARSEVSALVRSEVSVLVRPEVPALVRDTRGIAYIEFVFAFIPLFILFLATCQFAFIASARIIVQHAALRAARAAIVVLDDVGYAAEEDGGATSGAAGEGSATGDDSDADVPYANVKVGSLVDGEPFADEAPEAFLKALELRAADAAVATNATQNGARMQPIRLAAYVPLLSLVPDAEAVSTPDPTTLEASLPRSWARHFDFGLRFLRAAAVVSVHTGDSQKVATEVGPAEPVTVRVTLLFHCAVPLVSALICRTREHITGQRASARFFGVEFWSWTSEMGLRLGLAESPAALDELTLPGAYFYPITAEATLPNQGASYVREEDES